MEDPIPRSACEDLVTAAETYRAALVVRLAGEVGLRTAEIPRIRPRDLRESEAVPGAAILFVPAPDGGGTADVHAVEREAFVPASLSMELQRYADNVDLEDEEPFVGVSTRRVQMIVNETAERAATTASDPRLASITPRDLRQAFARRLLERGIDTHVVREAGGWRSMDALDPYLDPLDGEAIAEAVAVNAGNTGSPSDRPSGRDPSRTGAPSFSLPDGRRTLLDAFEAIPAETDREELFGSVVDRLAAGDRWRTAWVVRGAVSEDHSPADAAMAGTDTDVVAAAGVDADVSGTRGHEDGRSLPSVADGEAEPWNVAIEEGQPVVGRIGGDAVVSEEADRPGNGSVLAVPIVHRDATYGALCLRRLDPEPIAAAEQEAMAVFGRCLGWGVTAGRWRDLLHSDAVTEVAFRTAAGDAFLANASEVLGCRIDLDSAVTVSETTSRCYLRVSHAGPRAFADTVEAADGVSEPRVIETHEDGCTVSIRVSGGSIVRPLTEHGATVRDGVAADGEVQVVADLPDGTDVRPIADGLRRRYPGVRLVRKESVTRPSYTESSLRDGVTERLTDRQWAALSAAYHSGYFDWPRGSTAEEVADAMDVSSPTFHNHLRKAQRALLDTLFEA